MTCERFLSSGDQTAQCHVEGQHEVHEFDFPTVTRTTMHEKMFTGMFDSIPETRRQKRMKKRWFRKEKTDG